MINLYLQFTPILQNERFGNTHLNLRKILVTIIECASTTYQFEKK